MQRGGEPARRGDGRSRGGVLHLKDDEQLCYVAVDKIAVVWEARDDDQHRAGFVSGAIK